MRELLMDIDLIISTDFTKKEYVKLNKDEENFEIVHIRIGGLLFEFTVRDFGDGEGNEVNCECFILGKDTGYGYTEEKRDGKDGIPYDNDWCLNYFHKDDLSFEQAQNYIKKEISEFILLSSEYTKYANEKILTWKSLKE